MVVQSENISMMGFRFTLNVIITLVFVPTIN